LLLEIRKSVYNKPHKTEEVNNFFEEFDNKFLNQLKIMCYKVFSDDKRKYLEVAERIEETITSNKNLPAEEPHLKKGCWS
jgi:SPX domain protein involved in polyphosphate accumulation